MKVRCPTCKKETEYNGNKYRPFCSERCKIIDLGDWAQGKYAVPSEETSYIENDSQEKNPQKRIKFFKSRAKKLNKCAIPNHSFHFIVTKINTFFDKASFLKVCSSFH